MHWRTVWPGTLRFSKVIVISHCPGLRDGSSAASAGIAIRTRIEAATDLPMRPSYRVEDAAAAAVPAAGGAPAAAGRGANAALVGVDNLVRGAKVEAVRRLRSAA